jgi:hypothetical protein
MSRVNHIDLLNVLIYLSWSNPGVLNQIHCDGEYGRVCIFVDPKLIPEEDLKLILSCGAFIDDEGFFVLEPLKLAQDKKKE